MPLVKFTGVQGKTPLAIESSLILYVGKGKGGISTQIQTGINSPQGMLGFEVMESVDEVVDLVYEAIGLVPPLAKIPSLLKS